MWNRNKRISLFILGYVSILLAKNSGDDRLLLELRINYVVKEEFCKIYNGISYMANYK